MPCTCDKTEATEHAYTCVMYRPRQYGKNAEMTALRMLDALEHGLVREAVQRDTRPTWHEWALHLANTVATRADCTRRQVGAVILDAQHRVISTGYNGYPAGRPGCLSAGACPRGTRSHTEIPKDAPYVGTSVVCEAIHAEENAILYARQDLRDCTLYSTQPPCPNCQRFIKGAGVMLVIWPGAEFGSPMQYWDPTTPFE